MRPWLFLFIVLVLAANVRGAPEPQLPRYAVTDLGTLGGDWTQAAAINDRGEVAGISETSGSRVTSNHVFLWRRGQMQDLGRPKDAASLTVSAINDAGQIVGYVDFHGENPPPAGFLWQRSRFRMVLPDFGIAWGINGRGVVVGNEINRVGRGAERWYRDQRIRLPALGGRDSWGLAINNANEVAGQAETPQRDEHGFFYSHACTWSGRRITDLGTLGGASSSASGINDRGELVGWAETAAGAFHACLWEQGTRIDLGALAGDGSFAAGINNSGVAIGGSTLEDGSLRATVWINGKFQDLNDLIPRDAGWVLEEARGINSRGQIVGFGKHDGHARGFILTPWTP